MLNALLVLGGLVLLVAGGELLVRGAASLARRLGMSSLVVGLTVVSVATSAPEFAVTTGAVLGGSPDLAVGNVVGSNTANVLLILGVGAILAPLLCQRQLVRVEIPVMVGISVLMLLLALDGVITVIDGVILLLVYLAATALTVVLGRRSGADAADPDEDKPQQALPLSVVFIVAGVAALVVGAQLLVSGATAFATTLGISELVIGLTVVAIGTSLPELAATVVAVRRGEVDMAVGNVVGSCIANIGLVLGVPALLSGSGIPVPSSSVALDLPLMIASTLALSTVAFTGLRIIRLEGIIFVSLYAAYVAYMVLASQAHDALHGFTAVMVWFVLPLLLLAGAVSVWQEDHLQRPRLDSNQRHPL